MNRVTPAPAHPVLWRTAVDAPATNESFRYDEARSLNVMRDADGTERPFAASTTSTAWVKSDRAESAED